MMIIETFSTITFDMEDGRKATTDGEMLIRGKERCIHRIVFCGLNRIVVSDEK